MAAGSRYSDQQRREAVVCCLLHGNWKRVSELTGIPQRTLNDWATQSWFGMMLAEVRTEKDSELEGVYTRIIDEATGRLLDRPTGHIRSVERRGIISDCHLHATYCRC